MRVNIWDQSHMTELSRLYGPIGFTIGCSEGPSEGASPSKLNDSGTQMREEKTNDVREHV